MTEPVAQTEPRSATAKRTFLHLGAMQRLLAFGALIVLFVGFSLASPNFLQFDNMVGILLATTVNGVLALGVTFVIITGGIDLSIGTVMTLSAVMTGVFITNWHLPVLLGILAGLVTGTLAGIVNGTLIAKLKIPSFIATLGMLNVARGLALVFSGLRPIYFNDPPVFNQVAMGSGRGARLDRGRVRGADPGAGAVRRGHRGEPGALQDGLRALHLRAGLERGG